MLSFGQLLGNLFVFHSWWYHRVHLGSFNIALTNQLTALDVFFAFENTEGQKQAGQLAFVSS